MFTEIIAGVYLCSAHEANSTYFINTYRPQAIINFDEQPDKVWSQDILYVHFPLLDTEGNAPTTILEGLSLMKNVILHQHKNPVFIHCAAGVSRSPGMVALLLYSMGGFSRYRQALECVGGKHGDTMIMSFAKSIEKNIIPLLK